MDIEQIDEHWTSNWTPYDAVFSAFSTYYQDHKVVVGSLEGKFVCIARWEESPWNFPCHRITAENLGGCLTQMKDWIDARDMPPCKVRSLFY